MPNMQRPDILHFKKSLPKRKTKKNVDFDYLMFENDDQKEE